MHKVEDIRKEFPVVNNLIYLDHAAIAPLHTGTKKILETYTDHFTNYGIKNYEIWANKIEQIRSDFANFLGADSNEIAFIKNTSAGLSIIANGIKFEEGDNVIIPDIEFPANVYPWLNLQYKGINTKILKTENGIIDLQKLEELIDNKTRLVSMSWVEFSNGYKNDLESISKICKEKSRDFGRKIYFCVDAIQGMGALKINVSKIDIDFLAADGHKWFLAMEGAGILYCNKEIINEIHPQSVGWKSVKNPLDFSNIHFELQDTAAKFEEGSMNVAGILSLGASLELFSKYGMDFIEKRVLHLADYAKSLLSSKNIELISDFQDKHKSGIVSFITPDLERDFLNLLSNKIQLSRRGNALRISPHFYNTEEEIEKFVSYLE